MINTRPGGQGMMFTAKKDIFYYNDMSNTEGVSILSTVEENRNHYTQRQYEHAKIARELYHTVGCPSMKDYKNIIKINAINNFPATMEDIETCENILGPNIYILKGKTVRTKPK